MQRDARKAAIAAFKERKAIAGLYAVRCLATGGRWIGRSQNLASVQNQLWFTLRLGSSPHRTLQEAWRTHGAEQFVLEVVEQLDEEKLAYARDRLLKERLEHWCAALGAEAI